MTACMTQTAMTPRKQAKTVLLCAIGTSQSGARLDARSSSRAGFACGYGEDHIRALARVFKSHNGGNVSRPAYPLATKLGCISAAGAR